MNTTASNVDDANSIASRTRAKCKLNLSTQDGVNNDTKVMINHVTKLWAQLNDTLAYAPYFQNTNRKGVSEERIKQIESKLSVTLPAEIRAAITVHDGRNKIEFGLNHRLATTDLLPVAQWRPYETEYLESEFLFECLAAKDNKWEAPELREDARDHLTAYVNGIKEFERKSKSGTKNKYSITDDNAFRALPCELLIIGEGMDDYVEQYLLSVRTGRIYLGIHNLPDWTLIGTFADWIKMGIENATKKKKHIAQSYKDFEAD